MIEPGRKQVGAVIAAYNPDNDLISNAAAILKQVDWLVVVDDCSTSHSATGIFDQLRASGVSVLRHASNSGIGAAMNTGISALNQERDVDFVLTFDQDSTPVPDYVARALETYEKASNAGLKVGFVSAQSFSGHAVPTLGRRDVLPDGVVEAFDPMQSGFFIPRTTIEAIGDFESGFFIDCVDSEYTARARAAGYRILVGAGCEVEHRLGTRIPARLMGRAVRFRGTELSINYYSPLRMYYIMRNGTTLTRRYLKKAPVWVLRRLLEDAKAQVLRFTFSPGRRRLATAAWRGFADSLAGRQGRISSELANQDTTR